MMAPMASKTTGFLAFSFQYLREVKKNPDQRKLRSCGCRGEIEKHSRKKSITISVKTVVIAETVSLHIKPPNITLQQTQKSLEINALCRGIKEH